MKRSVARLLGNERGIGLVGALLVIAMLAILAAIIAAVAVNQRRSAFNEVLHSSSLVAADSGAEQAIGWLKGQDTIPIYSGTILNVNSQGVSSLVTHADQRFNYQMNVDILPNGQPNAFEPAGYDLDGFMRITFDVVANGEAGLTGNSDVSVMVSKIFIPGY